MERTRRSDGLVEIGDLAQRLGVSYRTLQFYEEKHLLASSIVGRVRHYDDEQCRRAEAILHFRRLGFSVEETRRLLAIGDGSEAEGSLKHAFERQIAELERRKREIDAALEELQRLTR